MDYSLRNLLRIFNQKESQQIPLDVRTLTQCTECLSGADILCSCPSSIKSQGSSERSDHMACSICTIFFRYTLTQLFVSVIHVAHFPCPCFVCIQQCKHHEGRFLLSFFVCLFHQYIPVSSSTREVVSPQYVFVEGMNGSRKSGPQSSSFVSISLLHCHYPANPVCAA